MWRCSIIRNADNATQLFVSVNHHLNEEATSTSLIHRGPTSPILFLYPTHELRPAVITNAFTLPRLYNSSIRLERHRRDSEIKRRLESKHGHGPNGRNGSASRLPPRDLVLGDATVHPLVDHSDGVDLRARTMPDCHAVPALLLLPRCVLQEPGTSPFPVSLRARLPLSSSPFLLVK